MIERSPLEEDARIVSQAKTVKTYDSPICGGTPMAANRHVEINENAPITCLCLRFPKKHIVNGDVSMEGPPFV
jgi:hypothetical protein